MIHKQIFLLFAFGLVVLINARCPRPRNLPRRVCARVFETSHWVENLSCTGHQRDILRNENKARLGMFWDDNVSAIVVRPGCKLDVYSRRNYRGFHRKFTGTAHHLKNYKLGRWILKILSWNNRISSWSCHCY